MHSFFIIWGFLEYRTLGGWVITSSFLSKTCVPPKLSSLSFLDYTRRFNSNSLFPFLFLCSYFLPLPLFPHGSTLLLTNSPLSLTETIYLFLRRNQTLTKVSASVVGKYIRLFSVMGILMVVWFALVSFLCSLIWLLEVEICGL